MSLPAFLRLVLLVLAVAALGFTLQRYDFAVARVPLFGGDKSEGSGCEPLEAIRMQREVDLPQLDGRTTVLIIGDQGADQQMMVAAAMHRYLAANNIKPDLGVTLGDNFYGHGIEPGDPQKRWQKNWEAPYGDLGFPFYALIGNHDRRHRRGGCTAELFKSKSPNWKLPGDYYVLNAGPARMIALNTAGINTDLSQISDEQLTWLRKQLTSPRDGVQWEIAFGHHPVASGGSEHWNETKHMRGVYRENFRLGKGVDLYLAGHDHDMQFISLAGGKTYAVGMGASGRKLRDVMVISEDDPEELGQTLFCSKNYGFALMEADKDQVKISFVETDGKQEALAFDCVLTRRPDGGIERKCSAPPPAAECRKQRVADRIRERR